MKKRLLILFVCLGCLLSSVCAAVFRSEPATLPTYQFRSTSTIASTIGVSYAPVVVTPFAQYQAPSRPRRTETSGWDEEGYDDEGNPNGQGLGNVDTPVGEPLVLLLMAVVYLILLKKRKKVQKNFVMS